MTTKLFSLRSHRLRIGILTMVGLYCAVSMRLNLSMAIVCMVRHDTSHLKLKPQVDNSTDPEYDVPKGCVPQTAVEYTGSLEWTPSMQSVLFSATFYGSLLTTLFAGRLSDRFGPKFIFMASLVCYSAVTFVSPFLAEHSYTAFFVARFVMGLGEGFIVPCVGTVLGRWYPHSEKSTMAGFCSSGYQLASLLSALFSANLCRSSIGWPSIFYLFGGMGAAWIVAWQILATDGPVESRFASQEEKDYLAGRVAKKQTKHTRVPWRALAASPVTLSIFACHFAHNFSTGIMMAFLPTYFKEYLFLPLQQVGTYTIVFFLGQLISKYGGGIISDYLNNSNTFGFTTTAKIMQATGGYISLFSLLGLAYMPSCEEPFWALVFLGFFGFGASATYSGFFTSLVSVAPRHSGVLTSLSSFWAIVGNILGPVLVGVIGFYTGNGPLKWTVTFLVGAAAMGISATLYLIWGSADLQPWGESEDDVKEVEETTNYQRMNDSKI